MIVQYLLEITTILILLISALIGQRSEFSGNHSSPVGISGQAAFASIEGSVVLRENGNPIAHATPIMGPPGVDPYTDNTGDGSKKMEGFPLGEGYAGITAPEGTAVERQSLEVADGESYGLDVSSHDGQNIDWNAVAASGRDFVFVKATEGTGYTNPYFIQHMDGAKASGMYSGPYHYARPDLGNTASSEADYFLSIAQNYVKSGYLRPVLDIEVSGLSYEYIASWSLDWIKRVESMTGESPILYGSASYVHQLAQYESELTDYSLWVAHYGVESPSFDPWDRWTVWQYSDCEEIPGIPTSCEDGDMYNGDKNQMIADIVISTACCGCLPSSCCTTNLAAKDVSAPTLTLSSNYGSTPEVVLSATTPAISPAQDGTSLELALPAPTPVPDILPPTTPGQLDSSSHFLATWSSNAQVHLRWSPATDLAGPLAGYTLVWDQNPTFEPVAEVGLPADATAATSPALASGAWYAHLRALDQAGNASETVHLGPFLIDTEPPVFAMWGENQLRWSNQPQAPTFSWQAASDEGELAGYKLYWGDDPNGVGELFITETSFTPTEVLESGQLASRHLRVAAVDAAGNQSDWLTVGIWQYDPIAPSGSLMVNGGGDTVRSLNVILYIDASDEGGGIDRVRFSSNGISWGEWEPYVQRKAWKLANSTEPQTIYAQVQDLAGNVSAMMPTTVIATLNVELPSSPNYSIARSIFGMGGGKKNIGQLSGAGNQRAGTPDQPDEQRQFPGSLRLLGWFLLPAGRIRR